MDNFGTVVLALTAGVILGGIFSWLKLPIPAPPTLPGIAGVVGVFLGYQLFHWVVQQWFSG